MGKATELLEKLDIAEASANNRDVVEEAIAFLKDIEKLPSGVHPMWTPEKRKEASDLAEGLISLQKALTLLVKISRK